MHAYDVYDRQFTHAENLKKSMCIHTGEKLHASTCDVWDKQFSQAEDLKRHMLIHAGKKPHPCDIYNR